MDIALHQGRTSWHLVRCAKCNVYKKKKKDADKKNHISGKWYLLPTISFTDKYLYGTYEISLEWLNFQIAISWETEPK